MRSATLLIVATLALIAPGCGGDDDYENRPRPPSPINVTASITDDRVSVSPTTFGAGPIMITVANLSGSPQTLTFETDEIGGSGPGIRKKTPEIANRDTGTLQVDVSEGSYKVGAVDDAIAPATVQVGGERASAQDQLLEP